MHEKTGLQPMISISIVDGNSPIKDNCWKLLELVELLLNDYVLCLYYLFSIQLRKLHFVSCHVRFPKVAFSF